MLVRNPGNGPDQSWQPRKRHTQQSNRLSPMCAAHVPGEGVKFPRLKLCGVPWNLCCAVEEMSHLCHSEKMIKERAASASRNRHMPLRLGYPWCSLMESFQGHLQVSVCFHFTYLNWLFPVNCGLCVVRDHSIVYSL